MEKTPTRVEDALFADGEEVRGIKLRELTLSTMLLLRQIDSPLFNKRPYDQEEWARTLYVMCVPASAARAALKHGKLEEDALEWADTFGPGTFELLLTAARKIVDRAFAFSPDAPEPADGEAGDAPAGEAPGAPETGTQPCCGDGRPCTCASPEKQSSTASPSPG